MRRGEGRTANLRLTAGASSCDTFQTGQTGDAISSFRFECVCRAHGGGGGVVRMTTVRKGLALVTVFDGGGRQCRQRRGF